MRPFLACLFLVATASRLLAAEGMTTVWVDPSVVVSRIGVSMTTMLTPIAYRFSLTGPRRARRQSAA